MGLKTVNATLNGKEINLSIGAEDFSDLSREDMVMLKNNAIDWAREICEY